MSTAGIIGGAPFFAALISFKLQKPAQRTDWGTATGGSRSHAPRRANQPVERTWTLRRSCIGSSDRHTLVPPAAPASRLGDKRRRVYSLHDAIPGAVKLSNFDMLRDSCPSCTNCGGTGHPDSCTFAGILRGWVCGRKVPNPAGRMKRDEGLLHSR